ncbi:hypothetical protein [Frankia sp. AiPa1]|uniref:hypothetical protein n=1 Tax=Frankia sp. AiPa1 TaxID=573492 RepID=UPI00202B09CD|nr:hypothetical protein [Frankia sp. AiPa1]MCL9759815.1 hypothetical protein [Frankia sp. AiPa1]
MFEDTAGRAVAAVLGLPGFVAEVLEFEADGSATLHVAIGSVVGLAAGAAAALRGLRRAQQAGTHRADSPVED